MALTKDLILAQIDLPREEIEVPEWGGTIWIGVMPGSERDAFEAESANLTKAGNGLNNFRARYCARAIVDDQGKRLFCSDADINALGQTSGTALDRIFDAARKINRLGDDDLEELEKNSQATQADGSSSG